MKHLFKKINNSSACRSIIRPKDEPFDKLVVKPLLEFNLCIHMFNYCKTLPKEWVSDFHLWPIDLKINMDHIWTVANQETNYDVSCQIAFSRQGFCIKCYCDLDLWPTGLNICMGSSNDCHQSSYQVQWWVYESLINFSRYWADTVFGFATVTLTFDLKMFRGRLLSMTSLPTKYHDCHSKTFQDIERTCFLHKMLLWPWHLT